MWDERPGATAVFLAVNAALGLAACALAIAVSARPARADLDRATHVRLQTENGPVHVWMPPGYVHATAGIVIYVHGYSTTADRAWREHRLARQFARSALNALFVVCPAPASQRDAVKWRSLGALLQAVDDVPGISLPAGRVVAVGHSGAHRTLSLWLDEDELDTIILVDAMYGPKPELRRWLDTSDDRRLLQTAVVTRRWADALHAALPETFELARFPSPPAGELPGARSARVVYVRSQLDHMQLITGGVALPMLLRATRLPTTESSSGDAPI